MYAKSKICRYVGMSKYANMKVAGRLLCIYAGIQVCKDAGKKYKIIQVLKYTTMIVWNYESVQSIHVCKNANIKV